MLSWSESASKSGKQINGELERDDALSASSSRWCSVHAHLQRLNASSGALCKAACFGTERLHVGKSLMRAIQRRN